MANPHGDPVVQADGGVLGLERDDLERDRFLPGVVARHRSPENADIDHAFGDVMHHVLAGMLEAGVHQ